MRLKTRFLLLALLIFSSADCFGEQLLMSRPRSSNEVDRSKFYDYKSRRKEKKENALSLRHQNKTEQKNMEAFLNNAVAKFKESDLSVSYTVIDNNDFNTTVNVSMQSLNAAFFKPNIIFASMSLISS